MFPISQWLTHNVGHRGQWDANYLQQHQAVHPSSRTVRQLARLWSRLRDDGAAPPWSSSGCEHTTHTHTHAINGPLSGTTRVSRYQKGKTNLDFTEARDSEWQWHQLGHMQVCTALQTDNHASTPPLSFYRPDALPAAEPTASKHWRHTEHTSTTV